MNIFVLDLDPTKCAQYHCDKHVVKMILETAQLLSTAHHINGTKIGDLLYKPTHKNHPCAIWARNSRANYRWLCSLGVELCKEYTKRYGKIHKTTSIINILSECEPLAFELEHATERPLAMPDQYRTSDPVKAYRRYYTNEKRDILHYKLGNVPDFILID